MLSVGLLVRKTALCSRGRASTITTATATATRRSAANTVFRTFSTNPVDVVVAEEEPKKKEQDNKDALLRSTSLRPADIVEELNRHIVGQNDAKRAVAIAMRNRWRRRQLPKEMMKEVTPRNVLMIGPTGCGKVRKHIIYTSSIENSQVYMAFIVSFLFILHTQSLNVSLSLYFTC